MNTQQIFERNEIKYLLGPRQAEHLLSCLEGHMKADDYGKTLIRNIYYDTPDHRLIRTSLEKPVYKEKLRVRSYRQVNAEDRVFVELKKKYKDVVYKRRVSMKRDEASMYLCGKCPAPEPCQITAELDYFLSFYGDLTPMVFLSYEREAYFDPGGTDLRLTLDRNILYREDHLSLGFGAYGTPILPPGATLLELKTSGGIPLWLSHFLNREQLRKTSFSKYGEAYTQSLIKEREVYRYA